MVKTNSNGKDEDRSIPETLGRVLFLYIPVFVILLIVISWIFGIIFSVNILVDLVKALYIAQGKFKFIIALASIIEFGLFISLTFIITLGLYTTILKPFLTEKHIQLSQTLVDFTEKVCRPFLTLVISILAIYILEIATGIIDSLKGANLLNYDEMYCKIIAMVLFAVVAVIIAIIIHLEK